ncbi:MAG: thymidylate synthase, partial [Minisyncoccales bacterium]
WFQAIDLCYKKGNFQPVTKGSFEQGQKRKQLFKFSGILNNPEVRPFEPKIPEQYNIPSPVSEGYVENEYIRKLIDSTSKEEGEDYVYAEWIEPLYPKVIDRLLSDGFGTNQMYIPVGDVASFDLKDPPCLRGIDVKVVNNKLHYDVTFRSWDLWAGFPANLGGLQVLKEMMVYDLQKKGADIQDGKIGFNSCGAHIYGYAWDLAKQRLNIK